LSLTKVEDPNPRKILDFLRITSHIDDGDNAGGFTKDLLRPKLKVKNRGLIFAVVSYSEYGGMVTLIAGDRMCFFNED
jgi:hypothetical protein